MAQINIAHPLFALDDPRMADFMDGLDRINALAERSDGFVWRLKGEGNDATDLRFGFEQDAIVNMSLWRDIDALQRFVWTTVHRRFFDRKPEWFRMEPGQRNFVMWFVPEGQRPTLEEAAERLARLRAYGSSKSAFGWEFVETKRWLGRVEAADATTRESAA
ncbi:MAG: DUF3291 domain-containing protein [Pseudomonadota bacterium]